MAGSKKGALVQDFPTWLRIAQNGRLGMETGRLVLAAARIFATISESTWVTVATNDV
mgnify:CR=1 FL=1